MAQCSICQTELKGTYCHQCGQKVTGKRLTIKTVVSDAFSNFFNLEGSGIATIWLIIKDPRKIIHNYIEGNKGHYKSPGRVSIYTLTVFGLSLWLGRDILGTEFTYNGASSAIIFFSSFALFCFLASYLVSFRKSRFVEHLIITHYLLSVWFFVGTFLDVLIFYYLLNSKSSIMIIVVLILYFIWVSRYVFQNGKWWKHLLNVILMIAAFVTMVGGLYYFTHLGDSSSTIEILQD